MRIQTPLFIILLMFSKSYILSSQVGINTTSTQPDASAMLDIVSSNKGILIPRMSTAERLDITSPAKGLMVFDNTTSSFWYHNGGQWIEVSEFDGNYSSLIGAPTNVSYFNNDAGYLTSTSPHKESIYDFTMISDQSLTYYYHHEATNYCDTLTQDGFDDWILPHSEEWMYLTSGGAQNTFSRSNTWLMMRDSHLNTTGLRVWGNTQGGLFRVTNSSTCTLPIGDFNNCPQYVRCIR